MHVWFQRKKGGLRDGNTIAQSTNICPLTSSDIFSRRYAEISDRSISGLLSSITRVYVGGSSSVDRATEAINGGGTIENVPWDKISRPGIRANHLLILMRVNIILLRDKRDISRGREREREFRHSIDESDWGISCKWRKSFPWFDARYCIMQIVKKKEIRISFRNATTIILFLEGWDRKSLFRKIRMMMIIILSLKNGTRVESRSLISNNDYFFLKDHGWIFILDNCSKIFENINFIPIIGN